MKSQVMDYAKSSLLQLKAAQNHVSQSDSLLYSNSLFLFTGLDVILDGKVLMKTKQANCTGFILNSCVLLCRIILSKYVGKPLNSKTR